MWLAAVSLTEVESQISKRLLQESSSPNMNRLLVLRLLPLKLDGELIT